MSGLKNFDTLGFGNLAVFPLVRLPSSVYSGSDTQMRPGTTSILHPHQIGFAERRNKLWIARLELSSAES
jgi:hypothetical protein